MLEQELRESKQSWNKAQFPMLAVDFGKSRIGLAVSDMKGMVAGPLMTVGVDGDIEGAVKKLHDIAVENRIKSILLGYPQAFVETHKKIQEEIKVFGQKLKAKTGLEVILYDESFSTTEAQNVLLSLGNRQRKARKSIDKVSAAIFLQQFLDSLANERKKISEDRQASQ